MNSILTTFLMERQDRILRLYFLECFQYKTHLPALLLDINSQLINNRLIGILVK